MPKLPLLFAVFWATVVVAFATSMPSLAFALASFLSTNVPLESAETMIPSPASVPDTEFLTNRLFGDAEKTAIPKATLSVT